MRISISIKITIIQLISLQFVIILISIDYVDVIMLMSIQLHLTESHVRNENKQFPIPLKHSKNIAAIKMTVQMVHGFRWRK